MKSFIHLSSFPQNSVPGPGEEGEAEHLSRQRTSRDHLVCCWPSEAC